MCNVSISNDNINCPIGKSTFAVNFPLNIFRATGVNADNGSLKSLHTLFDTCLDHMLAKFEPNHMVQNVQNFDVYDNKLSFLKQLFNGKSLIFKQLCFSVSKIMAVNKSVTCNQAKTCTKNGRPNQFETLSQ